LTGVYVSLNVLFGKAELFIKKEKLSFQDAIEIQQTAFAALIANSFGLASALILSYFYGWGGFERF